jgi:uncharacterized protein (TIGR02001 family)
MDTMRVNARQTFAALTLSGLSLSGAQAADVSAYAALTSDFVHRGVTQSDGNPALQLGGEVTFDNGVYAGIWGSTIDISNGPGRQRDLEFNYYLGVAYDLTDAWQLDVNVVAYQYPGAEGNIDYDYVEYTLSGNFDDHIWLSYSYSPDLYHSNQSTQNLDLYAEWPIAEDWTLGGGGGYYDVEDLSGRGYGYWHLGVTRFFEIADVDLRYHDANRWAAFVSTPDRIDPRVALTVRFPF